VSRLPSRAFAYQQASLFFRRLLDGQAAITPVLRGTYTPPVLRPGDLVESLVRDGVLVVSSWSDAPISWPRGCPPVQSPGSPSLIVDEELDPGSGNEKAREVTLARFAPTAQVKVKP
jgi:hypothetical protein